MFNRLAKPFFFSTLIVAVILAILSTIPLLIYGEDYKGYAAMHREPYGSYPKTEYYINEDNS